MQKPSIEHLSKKNSYKIWNQTEVIAAKFSKKALYYDQFANVQRFAANHLDNQIANKVNSPIPSNILEIGCGTGFLSRYLASRFPKSKIDFIDPADAMLSLCEKNVNEHLRLCTTSKNHNFIKKSIEDYLDDNPNSSQKYSLIVSSFTLHWVTNLASVINRLIGSLEIGGQFFFSYPTNRSFPEWKSVCQKLSLPFTGNKLPSAEALEFFAKPNEANIVWSEYSCKLAFQSALEFFRGMKHIGADATFFPKNPEHIFNTQQLSTKEFRQLLAAWNQMPSTKVDTRINNEKPNKYKQTVDCTYWLVEGIITRHG